MQEVRYKGMNEQELREKQNILMTEYKEWKDLQGEFSYQNEDWHICEQEKERISEECESIRRILYEMGCCE